MTSVTAAWNITPSVWRPERLTRTTWPGWNISKSSYAAGGQTQGRDAPSFTVWDERRKSSKGSNTPDATYVLSSRHKKPNSPKFLASILARVGPPAFLWVPPVTPPPRTHAGSDERRPRSAGPNGE